MGHLWIQSTCCQVGDGHYERSWISHEPFQCLVVHHDGTLDMLSMRGARHDENALAFAECLETQWVLHPGLRSYPDHEYAKKNLKNGYEGVLIFGVDATLDEVSTVVDNLKLCSHLESPPLECYRSRFTERDHQI